jgi:hypothetical protein
MNIESDYRKRKILKAAGEYDLEWCRWRVMGAQSKKKKEIYNPNPKGYIHGACLLKNTLYAFFGPDENRPTAVLPFPFSRCTLTVSRQVSGRSGMSAACHRQGTVLD